MSGREWAGGVLLAAALVSLVLAVGAGAGPLLTVTITSKPSDPTTSADASFRFSADARDATFMCSLDGARATTCRSPMSYFGLALGRHTFVVAAARGREQATARYAWTVQAPPPAPPPAPAPPKTAQLLVNVSGGGSLSSSVSGIACPPDCGESYPVGSQIALTPKASAGFAFAGWQGACTGNGGCAPTISAATYVGAIFQSTAKLPTLFRGDADNDGVANAGDRCSATSRGARPLLHGCALADLLQDGDALFDKLETYDYPGGYAQRFDGIDKLKPIHRLLMKNISHVRKGAELLEDGDVCAGADLLRKGARGLRGVVGKSKKVVGAMQVAALNKPSGVGDTDSKELEWAGLHYRQGIVEDLADEATSVQKAFGAACASLGPKVTLTGLVQKTDDASGSLLLANGTRVLLPDTSLGNDIALGRGVRIAGRRGPGGLVVAETLVALEKPLFKPLALKPCSSLLIAPVQPFGKPNPILHDPAGYKAQDMLQLEERMRIAASPEQCASKGEYRYSIAVEAEAFGVPKKTIAPDLDYLDAPVPLDLGASPPKLWTLTVTYRRQGNSCPPGSEQPQPYVRAPAATAKTYPCPVVPIGTQTYKAQVRGLASYAKAVYDKTTFDLESNAFAPAKVTGLTGVHGTVPSPSFEADGYAIVGNQSQGFHSKIVKNQLFAVWPEVWYGFPWLFPLDSIGVGHYAALVWPRIVGTRNGKPYRYAAQLPSLVTDLLPGCPGNNCFYRLPWAAGNVESVTQGNSTPIDDPADPPSHCCPPQQFAFDLVFQEGETIYATRGGVVGDVVESNTMNFDPCVNGPSADGPSNYVRVDHPGGRYSYYAHVQANSVIPAQGSVIDRGAPLAKVGNVGRSCGPHLHYQVASDSTNTIYGQTVQICFQGWEFVFNKFAWEFSPCFVPQDGTLLMSNNS